ncbi:sensor histidine kinase [Cohnella silvisoli]|uniref:histidine kinase n=1 Tax=Cohnella silvisoli TaxID=2873699 RepID=A0ABV1L181_9BACL|nr:HAMP domain-containing sensor histidine kinase [Cohnella silvisoli]MCD9025270.1 HAMP domain-containing histidine kinase [Cohnella silvisoli]
MRKRSISTKLFVITSVFLIGLITLMMFLQLQTFESYYKAQKISTLKNKIEKLKSLYVPNKDPFNSFDLMEDINTQNRLIKALSDMTNESIYSTIIRIDGNNGIKGKVKYFMFEAQAPEFQKKMMMLIDPAVQEWASDKVRFTKVIMNETIVYETKAAQINDSNNSIVLFSLLSGKPCSKTMNCSGDMGVQDVLVSVTSLQPVGEAAGVIRNLYPYFLALAVVVILLLTFLYSRMISRPLVRLNAVASQMANLDFSVRSDVKSQDEIGSLGNTLNFLSQNLDETLRQLHSANRKLTADIEKERQLEQMRKEFVAGVSHELKTPISLISGYAEGLKENIVGEERRGEYLDVIMEEAGRMSDIITDLLDLSQLESMKYKLNVAVFPMGKAIHSILNKMSIDIEKKGIRCELMLLGEEIHVFGDRLRIGQVLANLLSNAIKHSPPGGIIRIGLSRSPGQSEARIDVFNEGDSIPEDELAQIWDAFYKVEKSRSRDANGTGIGLAIVSSILLLHDSRFGVANRPGGVNFHFTLPIGKEEIHF